MKLARPLLFFLSFGLFAMQFGGYRGFRQYDYSNQPSVPSEFYWSRLQYTSGYARGGSFGYRSFRGIRIPPPRPTS